MSKSLFNITVGAILAGATAMAQSQLTLAIVALVIGTCVAGATALAQIVNPPIIDPPAGNPEPHAGHFRGSGNPENDAR